MRGVRVNTVGDTGGVLRVSVLFAFIGRTSIEVAEQAPPRAGPAQATGATNDLRTGRVAHRSPTRAGGFVFAEPDGSRATSIRAGGDAPDTRDIFVKPGSERPFYTTVHREPSTM